MKQGDKFQVPVKVNWALPDKQNVSLAAEPMAQNPQNNPITVQVPTQPTKDKPEGVVNFDVKANAAPGTYSIALKGVAQVPFASPRPMGRWEGAERPGRGVRRPIQVTVIPRRLRR